MSLHASVFVQCVCLVCMVYWMRMAQPSLVITYIPAVRGRRNPEMTLQIQLLAFHLLLTATWLRHRTCIPLLLASRNTHTMR